MSRISQNVEFDEFDEVDDSSTWGKKILWVKLHTDYSQRFFNNSLKTVSYFG